LISLKLRIFSAIGAAALSGTSTAVYAAAIEPERLVTTCYRLTPPGWNAGRLSVVAITDLHAGGPNMLVEHIVAYAPRTRALAAGGGSSRTGAAA
jgi:hypothetical protein